MFSNLIRITTSAVKGGRTLSTLVGVQTDSKTGVSTVTLQRPPVCSINVELASDLLNVLTDLEKNRSRGMILTSSSPTVFSAGLDILEMYQPDPDRVRQFWTTLQDLWLALYGSSYPTVAAINGHSPAGGCMLACSCEYRVMVEQGKTPYTIGLNETKLGIIAPPWFISSFRNTLSRRIAESALIAGKLFTADEAKNVGLVDELASDKADAISKAESWLAEFRKIPPAARAGTKNLLRGGDIQWLKENKKKDLDVFLNFVTSDAVQKGLSIYLENLKKKGS